MDGAWVGGGCVGVTAVVVDSVVVVSSVSSPFPLTSRTTTSTATATSSAMIATAYPGTPPPLGGAVAGPWGVVGSTGAPAAVDGAGWGCCAAGIEAVGSPVASIDLVGSSGSCGMPPGLSSLMWTSWSRPTR